jgi:hypothetical protein
MKFLHFFLFLRVIYALLDPDPATQINADPGGSGSATLVLESVGEVALLEKQPAT